MPPVRPYSKGGAGIFPFSPQSGAPKTRAVTTLVFKQQTSQKSISAIVPYRDGRNFVRRTKFGIVIVRLWPRADNCLLAASGGIASVSILDVPRGQDRRRNRMMHMVSEPSVAGRPKTIPRTRRNGRVCAPREGLPCAAPQRSASSASDGGA